MSAILALGQACLFLAGYSKALGSTTAPIGHHLALVLLLCAAAYGLASQIVRIDRAWLRRPALAALGMALTAVTTVFYAGASLTLYGFRNLPTRGIVKGYFAELPAMVASLPFDRWVGACIAALALAIVAGVSIAFAWSLEGLRTPGGPRDARSQPPPLSVRPSLALTPVVALALAVIHPAEWQFRTLEPWIRSLHDRQLGESSLFMQSNPIEAARDRQLESEYPVQPIGNRMNVVLVYVDGLRADVLQPYGAALNNMPFTADLVARGEVVQFPRVFAGCSMTLCGLGSILQSRAAHRVTPENFSLPRLLKRQGYEVRYLLSGDHQSFLNLKDYYGPAADYYRDGKDIGHGRSHDDVAVFERLSELPPSGVRGKPQFMMFGLMSAHVWGLRHDEFRRYLPDRLTTTSFADLDRNSKIAYRNNYYNGVLQADSVLRTIWHWLRDAGYLKDSVVVVTSDHGEALGEHGQLGHARSLRTPELLIPLWIHDPTGRLKAQDLVFQQDISPTILDLLGLPIPQSWEGASLVHGLPSDRWQPLYFINGRDQFGLIRRRDGRVVKYDFNQRTGRESIHDLDADLLETNHVATQMTSSEIEEFRVVLRQTFGPMLVR